MVELLKGSKEIIDKAIKEYNPYAVVCMVSGGDDSITALHVAKKLGVQIDFIIHGVTGTGIQATTDFVREHCDGMGPKYIEADAGKDYEDYVLRKGFFGIGIKAHAFSYHVLKKSHFYKAVSRNIRHRKRNRNILLINGARQNESENRKKNLTEPIRCDPDMLSNIWVNIIHHWDGQDCKDFLKQEKIERNPVAKQMCRSGECLCGTMQNNEVRAEASYLYPEWGKWLDDLEKEVISRGFTWKWGEDINRYRLMEMEGQQTIDFQPMCTDCLVHAKPEKI